MDYEEIRTNVSKNLIKLRKSAGLTQAQFGEKFSFSDKTISKWESGASIPDVATLEQIATEFNVSIDELVKNNDLTEATARLETGARYSLIQRILLLIFIIAFFWALAGLGYIFILEFYQRDLWPIFLWAIPFTSIAITIFNSRYAHKIALKLIAESVTVWSILIASYYSLLKFNTSFRPLFFLGIPLELSIILFAILAYWRKAK